MRTKNLRVGPEKGFVQVFLPSSRVSFQQGRYKKVSLFKGNEGVQEGSDVDISPQHKGYTLTKRTYRIPDPGGRRNLAHTRCHSSIDTKWGKGDPRYVGKNRGRIQNTSIPDGGEATERKGLSEDTCALHPGHQ